jgi:hypothetical protein
MPRLREVSDLITDVRRRADIENVTQRFTDAEIREYINQSIARLYTVLERLDSTYYTKRFTLVTTVGTELYDLTSTSVLAAQDFWTLKGVEVAVSGNIKFRARKYMPNEHAWINAIGVWGYGLPVFYRLEGNNLAFSPVPSGTYTLTISYTPLPQRLGDGDMFDGIAGFEEWVVLDAAIKVKRKNNIPANDLMADKAEVEKWIESLGSSRDEGEPEHIQDVQSADGWLYPWGSTQ